MPRNSYTSKFITMENLETENLGSQMGNFAALATIAQRTGHRIAFFEEKLNLGKTLQIQKHFKNFPLDIISTTALSDDNRVVFNLPLSTHMQIDPRIYEINPGSSYNIHGLFHSYRYWYAARNYVKDLYRFNSEVVNEASNNVESARIGTNSVVSIHVRRGDYIGGAHVNLSLDYYLSAIEKFKNMRCSFLVFSDDLSWCIENFKSINNLFFSKGATPIIDMASMALCDHKITANSSFSTWGAILNKNYEKIVVCPLRFLKNDSLPPYLNYAWHPDTWIGIGIGNT